MNVMDKSSVCRLCGTGEGIKFKIFDPGRDYISKIHQLLPIMIHEQDPWPKLICHRCAFKLQEFYDFREICIKTDSYLKMQGSAPVQQKPWEQQQQHQQQPTASSWMQPPPDTNPQPVRIKQEVPEDPPPPLLSPQSQTQQMVHQQAMMHQHPLMQQSYQQAQLMPQLMSMLASPISHSPHLMMQRQPPTAPSPQQAPQLQLPMVQFNQKSVDINPGSKNFVRSTPRTAQSQSNAVFLNSGEGGCFLPEGPDGAESDSSGNGRDMDSQGISDHDNNEKSSGGQKNPRSARKRKRASDRSYRRKRSRPKPKPQSSSKSKVNVNDEKKPLRSSTEQVIPRGKPGPKSRKPVESQKKNTSRSREALQKPIETLNANVGMKVETNSQKNVRKPGPKSKVGNRESDCEDADISFVLYKPPNSILDTIDMTQETESRNESEDDGNPAEGLPSHVLLTKIPGICNIYTCTLCECTVTSKKRVFDHPCTKNTVEGDDESTELETEEGEFADPLTGLYKCDVCSMMFTRHVTLVAHKDRHLYTMSDSDSMDSLEVLRKKKKKTPPLPNTVLQ